ncbi:MAG: hypothetical protein IT442_03295 [Phycisphaeraceae bacterium]|nr:hypothetical protein [Phycisphaeraceae bacterium]
MPLLTQEQFHKARRFILDQGRPLERALFVHAFEGGDQQGVLDALSSYQNGDGGFGHALEPDFCCDESSALATTVAFQCLRELGVPSDHPLVQRGIRYFLDTYDSATRCWMDVPPAVNNAPHAPWWHYRDDEPRRMDRCLANPRAEITAYLHEHAELVPGTFLRELTETVVQHLNTLADAMEMHDLLCYIRLAETKRLPESLRETIMPKLRRAVDATVAREPSQWLSYGLRPLDVVESADSPFASQLDDVVQANLDFEISRQEDDGAWPLNFSWGDVYPQAAQKAAIEWRGRRALQLLQTLGSCDRLAR